jgi:hypothetical protein
MTLVVSLLGAPLFAVGNRRQRGGSASDDVREVPPDVAIEGPTPQASRARTATHTP